MKGIRITAKVDGFRRGGISHHGTTDHPLSTFSAGQLAQLKAEPLLMVEEVDLPDPETSNDNAPPSRPSGKGSKAP